MSEENKNVDNMDNDTLNLGGVIQLSGFRELDRATMVVVKKLVGSYARKFSDSNEGFEKIILNLKKVHGKGDKEKGNFEMNAKMLISGKPFVAESTGYNLFVVLDDVLKKLENQLQK